MQSPDKIDVKESYVLLETMKTIIYNITNGVPIPTILTVQVLEFGTVEAVGDGKPIIPILYNNDDENIDWYTTVFCNKDTFIELSYETLFYSDIEHGRARFYRLRNLGNVLFIGFRFFRPLTLVDAFKYAHFGAFMVHQICNERFYGPGPFMKSRRGTITKIFDKIEKLFSPSLVRELLKQIKCSADLNSRRSRQVVQRFLRRMSRMLRLK